MEQTQKEQQGLRLHALIESLSLNQKEFSRRVGVTQGYLSRVLSGHKSISRKMTNGISISFPEVNQNWLTNGLGEMILAGDEKKRAPDVVMEPSDEYGNDPLSALRRMVEDYRALRAELTAQGEDIERLKAAVRALEEKG